jgi:hypothetical protein
MSVSWPAETPLSLDRRSTLAAPSGMARARLSTTVDAPRLDVARRIRFGSTDAALIDEALNALLARHRAAEIDVSYT